MAESAHAKISVQARVVMRGRCLRTMSCYLPDYQVGVGTWAARISCVSRTSRRTAKWNGYAIQCLESVILCTSTLALLLVMGGVEENPGPSVEVDKIMLVLCSGCDRILKSGIDCDNCGRWFHNSGGNVKAGVAESGK